MDLRAVDVMRTLALVGAAMASSPGIAQTPPRPRPPAPPVVPLRPDGCPVAQPADDAVCTASMICQYPPHSTGAAQCSCVQPPARANEALGPLRWSCAPQEFVGVGPLSPPELAA